MAIKGQTETVTPAIAQKYLENMTTNRPLRSGVVEFYARQMKDGLWKANGQGLIFDEGGKMLDGQHRCWAVIECGLNVEMMVTRGVKREAFDTIDTGAARSAGDVLGIKGWEYPQPLGAALRWAHAWARGLTAVAGKQNRMSNHEMAMLAQKYPTLTDHVSHIYAASGNSPLGRKAMMRAPLAFARWAMFQADPKTAADFWDKVENGEGLSRHDPEYIFREKLHEDFRAKKKEPPRVMLAYCILAWNAKVSGVPIKILRYGEEEQFPDMAGDLLGPKRMAAAKAEAALVRKHKRAAAAAKVA